MTKSQRHAVFEHLGASAAILRTDLQFWDMAGTVSRFAREVRQSSSSHRFDQRTSGAAATKAAARRVAMARLSEEVRAKAAALSGGQS
jgi:hypothetical protein